jgi:glycosyltransferase involved in cell wall biosynthesis
MRTSRSDVRIGILTSAHPPMDTRIYFKQARALAAAGHDVYLVARAGGEIQDVHYVPVRVPSSRLARLGTCMQVLLRAARLRCDVYHIHDPELLPGAVLLKFLTQGRLVYDIHEKVRKQILNRYWIPRWLRTTVARGYGAIERLCMPWVDHVVLAEESYQDEYPGSNVTVVRNYPILAMESEGQPMHRGPASPILVYCGTVAEIRGGLEMVEATALLREQFPDIQLRIIGMFFPEGFEARMRARVAELGLTDQVRLYGRLPFDAALREVERCDIGLALLHPDPNYVESLATKLFEYMWLRLPVVASNFAAWKALIERFECGVAVDPLSPASIADAVAELAADREHMQRLGENGRAAVLNHYSWQAEAQKLLSVYARFESTHSGRALESSALALATRSGEPPESAEAPTEPVGSSGGSTR